MDYEKAYKEALKRAKCFKTDECKDVVGYIFPELKESEDERIRKALINGFNKLDKSAVWYNGITNGQILAWLEKQGKKPIDKVEPKFHDGDWVINKQGNVHQIANVVKNLTNHTYGYDTVDGLYFNDNTEGVRLWTLQDAKDGDVLAFDSDTIVIFKDLYNATTFHSYCHIEDGVFTASEEGVPDWWEGEGFNPATKEQRDILFQKMRKAGYEWDAEKLELRKIEQKPAWSEEDKRHIDTITSLLEDRKKEQTDWGVEVLNEEIAWVKSLKDGVQPRREWSEEDENIISLILSICNDFLESFKISPASTRVVKEDVDKIENWLKSLRPQNTWKPSDDQMEALRYVTNFDYGGHKATLVSLYEQLKKLKEE